jgi:cation diffusion facilitator family transporter
LLLITCAWIIYEAVQRLFFKSVTVEISIWAFLVMGVSIFIDYNRSKMLSKAAKKYHSQALEADALHFSTDIWSSSVVILGLALAWIGEMASDSFPVLKHLEKADAISALGVALIVIYVSVELGMRTIQGLLDTAPKGLTEQLASVVAKVPGIQNVHSLRVRHSGPSLFVDAHVMVDGSMPLIEAHALTETIEQEIKKIAPESDITIHVEPLPVGEKTNLS